MTADGRVREAARRTADAVHAAAVYTHKRLVADFGKAALTTFPEGVVQETLRAAIDAGVVVLADDAAELRRDNELMRRQLSYAAKPTMGLPVGRAPAEFARTDATESLVRLALSTCIHGATQTLAKLEANPYAATPAAAQTFKSVVKCNCCTTAVPAGQREDETP